MNGTALKILRAVAKRGELPLSEAIELGRKNFSTHRDQYPLALLIEEEYLGCTLKHTPPPGAEKMREFTNAMMLHSFTVPPDQDGVRHYLDTQSTGGIDPSKEKVFIKGKGLLLLDQRWSKWVDRISSFIVGLGTGLLSKWLLTVLGFK